MSKVNVPGLQHVKALDVNQELVIKRIDKNSDQASITLNGRFLGYVPWSESEVVIESFNKLTASCFKQMSDVIKNINSAT